MTGSSMNQPKIKLYALTTCEYCQSLKRMLVQLSLEHEVIELDVLTWDERTKAIEELKKVNPACSFPTTVIGDQVIVGPKAQEIKKVLGIRTETDDLYEKLKVINEKKGYYFNRNEDKTFELLKGLLVNKDRYGYMVCPCRLASGSRDTDRDIICPCRYRELDVQEYGSCYCGLYVSDYWNKGMIDRVVVPERRPAELY
jgi:ferredoxin-thioredoxin reductase catalytic subunit/glutaredoxin